MMNRILAATLLASIAFLACSSSSSNGSGATTNQVFCEKRSESFGLSPTTNDGCYCNIYTSGESSFEAPNDVACNPNVGTDAVCFAYADGFECECESFDCGQVAGKESSTFACGYGLAQGAYLSATTPEASCTGAFYCLEQFSEICQCKATACDSTETAVASCTSAEVKTTLLQNNDDFDNDGLGPSSTVVSDCRVALGGGGSPASGGTPTDNKCPSGPGKCENGDSSTCGCGESCVQTATCVGCAYECVKGCATDADCAGYYSGDSPPAPLTCIPASSTMPTAHCGL